MANPTTISINHHNFPFLLLLLLLLVSTHAQLITTTTPLLHPDALPLLTFKSAVDKSNRLSTWNLTSATPTTLCTSWYGVSCNPQQQPNTPLLRVTKLVLESLNLTGTIPSSSLTSLPHLRVLSLSHNSLSGHIPRSLLTSSNFTSLRLIFLSHNLFTGSLPFPSLPHLYRLDLSYNNLTGTIPEQINNLSQLLTLRLESNHFSGPIPNLNNLKSLQNFNISYNNLGGEIPSLLSKFPSTSFSNNTPALCGAPLPPCKRLSSDPTRPGSTNFSTPPPPSAATTVVVSSSPSEAFPKPGGGSDNDDTHSKNGHHHSKSKLSFAAIILIVLADILVLALICLLLCWYFLRHYSSSSDTGKKNKNSTRSELTSAAEKVVYSNTAYSTTGISHNNHTTTQTNLTGQNNNNNNGRGVGFERGKMVFFEGAKRFELEDLLRASAEMLGKGVFGTAYKAVLDDGSVVAVKRLKLESGRRGGSGNEFEERMEVLGKLRHPNLVGLKAYYLAKDEKLLVFDYLPNGSLFWLLHGNRGPGRTPLDWTTRLKIAAGAARAITFLHSSSTSSTYNNNNKTMKLTHGNIKSTNVLIDKSGHACVSDFGLASFIPQTSTSSNSGGGSRSSNGYRAPEITDNRKLTAKADVYAFGVLLLELLTGKCPSLVDGTSPYDGAGGVAGGVVVDLPRWVQSVVREEWTAEVFDLELMRYKDIEEEMVGLLQIAMACTASAPEQRPKMAQVVKMIDDIRSGCNNGPEDSPSQDTAATSTAEEEEEVSPSVSSDNNTAAAVSSQ